MQNKIPVFAPVIDDDTLAHVKSAFDNIWLGMGNITQSFETQISEFIGCQHRHVIACNTGTSALHLALKAARVGPGDEVIIPSFDYVADHQAIRYTGASPVLCDIRLDNLGIDCQKAHQLVGPKTKAIVPLHFAGIPCDIAGVYALAKKYNLRVIEDAMHAFGTTIGGNKIGADGDITCFSFDPVKIITSIDGGCVIVNSEAEREAIRRMRFLGVDKETAERYKNKRSWEYDVTCEGYRYHLNNIMAAIGVSQVKRVASFIATRQSVCHAYVESFERYDDISLITTDYNNISPFIFSMRVNPERRHAYIDHMKQSNIDIGIHFLPVHQHTAFQSAKRGDMSVTERVAKEVVTLPLHSNMTPETVERVIKATQTFFDNK